jgi:16S rRNA C1402 (ribose-2'-O) methylase RsmI
MSQSTTVTGQLTLVAAPIGNLGDMTPRAIEALKTVDAIACEDTRVTGKLMSKLGIEKTSPLLSYREENEKHMAIELAGPHRIRRANRANLRRRYARYQRPWFPACTRVP